MVEKNNKIADGQGTCCPFCKNYRIRYSTIQRKYKCYGCGEYFKEPETKEYTIAPNFQKKRKPEDVVMWSKEKLLERMHLLENLRNKALVSVLYLTGCRVSEAIKKLRCGQIKAVKKEVNGKEEVFIYFYNMLTLKKPKDSKNKYRDIPIHYKSEKQLIDYLDDYLDLMQMYYGGEEEFENGLLFPISRQAAHKYIKRHLGIWPHYLRTMRFTHLVNKGLDAFDLKKLANWSSIAPSEYYVMRNLKDIERKMAL